jgi:hypothetical protein
MLEARMARRTTEQELETVRPRPATVEAWVAQALEEAPPITSDQSATLSDLLADARN